MEFSPNYKTNDNFFDVDIDVDSLNFKSGSIDYMRCSNDITNNVIQVYNNNTNKASYKSLYLSKDNRLYFTGSLGKGRGTKRYYINELIPIDNLCNKICRAIRELNIDQFNSKEELVDKIIHIIKYNFNC